MKVYIAGPLFYDGEKRFNEHIDGIIRECGHETYLPQRDGGVIAEMPETVNGVSKYEYVFKADLQHLQDCDLFLFLMDGRVPDEGASFAMGYAYAHGKRCAAYKTDARTAMNGEDNLMLKQAVEAVLRDEKELRAFFECSEE